MELHLLKREIKERWLHEHSRYYDIRIIYNLTSTNSYQHQHYHNIIWYIYKYFLFPYVSDHLKSKAPHPIPHWEVKSLQAWLVLSWGTRREVHVLLTFLLYSRYYYHLILTLGCIIPDFFFYCNLLYDL